MSIIVLASVCVILSHLLFGRGGISCEEFQIGVLLPSTTYDPDVNGRTIGTIVEDITYAAINYVNNQTLSSLDGIRLSLHPIEVGDDTKSEDASLARMAVSEFNSNPSVIGTIGPRLSSTTVQIEGEFQKPTVGFGRLTNLTENEWFIRMPTPCLSLCKVMLGGVYGLNSDETASSFSPDAPPRVVVLVDPNDEYSKAEAEDCVKAAGLNRVETVSEIRFRSTLDESNFEIVAGSLSAVLDPFHQTNTFVSVLVLLSSRFTLENIVTFLQVVRNQGVLRNGDVWILNDIAEEILTRAIFEDIDLWEDEIIQNAFEGLNVVSNALLPFKKTGYYLEQLLMIPGLFEDRTFYWQLSSFFYRSIFDSVLLYADALRTYIENEESTEFTPEEFRDKGIFNSDFLGATGRVSYLKSNHGDRSFLKTAMFNIDPSRIIMSSSGSRSAPIFPVAEWSDDTAFRWDPAAEITFPGGRRISTSELVSDVPMDEFASWEWLPTVGLSPEMSAGVCMELHSSNELSEADGVILYGGLDEAGMHSNLFRLDLMRSRWIEFQPSESSITRPPSSYHSCIVSSVTDVLYVFGGTSPDQRYLDELWKYPLDFVSDEWALLDPDVLHVDESSQGGPPARTGAGFVLLSDDLAVLFFGRGENGLLDDIWTLGVSFDYEAWFQLDLANRKNVPDARSHFSYAAMSKETLLIWGGRIEVLSFSPTSPVQTNDAWALNVTSREWRKLVQKGSVPAPRFGNGAAVMSSPEASLFWIMFGHSIDGSTGEETILNDFGMLWFSEADDDFEWLRVSPISGDTTKPRCDFSMTAWGYNLLFYGGLTDSTGDSKSYLTDLWVMDAVNGDVQNVHHDFFSPDPMARAVSFLFGHQIYVFGGVDANQVPQDWIRIFNTDTLEWEKYSHPDSDRPEARENHCGAQIEGRYYVFGGKNVQGISLNDLWVFSPFSVDNSWNFVEDVSVRSETGLELLRVDSMFEHTCARYGYEKIVVIGGRWSVEEKIRPTHFYIFDSTELRWTRKRITNEGPDSLLHCNSFVFQDDLYLEGCEGRTGRPLDKIWVLDVARASWKSPLDVPSKFQSSRHSLTKISEDQNKNMPKYAYLAGNVGNNIVSNRVVALDLVSREFEEIVPTTWQAPMPRQHHRCEYVRNRLFCIGGQLGETIKSDERDDESIFAVDYGTPRPGLVAADVWVMNLGTVCDSSLPLASQSNCVPCSPGTYELQGTCRYCPRGTFSAKFGASECENCFGGFYGDLVGAQEGEFCLPCENGTFRHRSDPIRSECQLCGPHQFCPIATEFPVILLSLLVFVFSPASVLVQYDSEPVKIPTSVLLPRPYAKSGTFSTIMMSSLYGTGLLLWIIIVVVVLTLWRCDLIRVRHVLAMDCFYSSSHGATIENDMGPGYPSLVVQKPTLWGGVFSVLAILIVVGTLAANAIVYFSSMDDDETMSMMHVFKVLPGKSGKEKDDPPFYVDYKSRFEVLVTLQDYHAACVDLTVDPLDEDGFAGCPAEFRFSPNTGQDSGFKTSTVEKGLRKHRSFLQPKPRCRNETGEAHKEGICQVSWICDDCFLDKSFTTLGFEWKTQFSYVSQYKYEVSAISGYDAGNPLGASPTTVTISGVVDGQRNKVFRGLVPSTEVFLLAIPTNYEWLRSFGKRPGVGYFLDASDEPKFGREVSSVDFNAVNGFSFQISFERSDYSLQVQRSNDETLFQFIPSVFGSAVGMMGSVGVLLTIVELIVSKCNLPNDLPEWKEFRERRASKKQAKRRKSQIEEQLLDDKEEGGEEEGPMERLDVASIVSDIFENE